LNHSSYSFDNQSGQSLVSNINEASSLHSDEISRTYTSLIPNLHEKFQNITDKSLNEKLYLDNISSKKVDYNPFTSMKKSSIFSNDNQNMNEKYKFENQFSQIPIQNEIPVQLVDHPDILTIFHFKQDKIQNRETPRIHVDHQGFCQELII
jgi:hypothetical protein